MVVQLGLSGKRLGSPANWTRKQIITERCAGLPVGVFCFLHLAAESSGLSLSSCGCLVFIFLPPASFLV